jgi:hypothetical protein
MKYLLFILMAISTDSFAFEVIGKLPPSSHTAELGTYTPYESKTGARRYYLVDETSICTTPKLLTLPSRTFSNKVGGLYKYWKSPRGLRTPYPVSFAKECQIPESEEPNVPPPQTVNFTGLSRISINPTPTDPNDCTFLEWKVTAKNIDDTYTMQIIRWFDASQMINGVRKCPYE